MERGSWPEGWRWHEIRVPARTSALASCGTSANAALTSENRVFHCSKSSRVNVDVDVDANTSFVIALLVVVGRHVGSEAESSRRRAAQQEGKAG